MTVASSVVMEGHFENFAHRYIYNVEARKILSD